MDQLHVSSYHWNIIACEISSKVAKYEGAYHSEEEVDHSPQLSAGGLD